MRPRPDLGVCQAGTGKRPSSSACLGFSDPAKSARRGLSEKSFNHDLAAGEIEGKHQGLEDEIGDGQGVAKQEKGRIVGEGFVQRRRDRLERETVENGGKSLGGEREGNEAIGTKERKQQQCERWENDFHF